MTDEPVPPRARKHRRFTLAQLVAERRRAMISFAAGLIVLLAIQFPVFEQSFLGGPDREMMETAFRLRADVTGGRADPVLLFDIDDRTLSKLAEPIVGIPPPLETVPRTAIADLLEFIRTAPPNQSPRVVVLDVDVAQPSSDGEAGVERLGAVLTKWAATRTAPPLIIAREAYPASSIGLDSPHLALPDTPYDAIVQPAPNIFWSEAAVLSDLNGVIREFLPYQCVIASGALRGGPRPLYSAAMLAYGFAERDSKTLDHAPAHHWMTDAAAHCQSQPDAALKHGERIDFHFSLESKFMNRVWPDLAADWPGFAQCGRDDAAIFRRLSAGDILDAVHASQDTSRAILCQHVVLIGGTNASGADFVQTPLNEMNGTVVLANAIRGLQLTGGGLRPIPLLFQIALLAVVSLTISATALATEHARRRYRQLKRSSRKTGFGRRIGILILNPIILNGLIALTAHIFGIGLTMVSLTFGYWGFLSAPVFASAITETVQEFADG